MPEFAATNVSAHRRYGEFLDALVQGDRQTCTRITERLLEDRAPVLDIYQRLYRPALYRVGELWAAHRLSIATEHMATAITEQQMNRIYASMARGRPTAQKALVATLAGERHQVGAKMAADVFELRGWDSVFAGAGHDIDELLSLVETEEPDVLGLSFSIYFHLETLEDMLRRVRAVRPQLPVLVGGQGLLIGGADIVAAFPGVTAVSGLTDLVSFIDSWPSTATR